MDREVADLLVCPRTRQPLETEVLLSHEGEIEYGWLRSEAGRYPVLAGIPVFTPLSDQVADLMRSEHFAEAAAVAALRGSPTSRMLPVLTALPNRLRSLTSPFERWLQKRTTGDATKAVFGPGEPGLDVIRRLYLEGPRRSVDAFDYFAYRFGTPRHLIALALLESADPAPGPLLDAGAGAGHIAYGMRKRFPSSPLYCVDTSLALLMVGRSSTVPSAHHIAADLTQLPFADGHFSLVHSTDVLPYVDAKRSAVGEMERVLRPDGALVVSALRNRECEHVHSGRPLSPTGWQSLFGTRPQRWYRDEQVLMAYLAGRTPPGDGSPPEELQTSQTISALLGERAPFHLDTPMGDWPHSRGSLAVNPLYESQGEGVDRSFELRWPSATYRRDHPLLSRYLPKSFRLPPPEAIATTPTALDELVAKAAVLAVPERYVLPVERLAPKFR
jgi:SAM-dependent methyltransferase/uncharacterized protein YbaR (Trm112 family)